MYVCHFFVSDLLVGATYFVRGGRVIDHAIILSAGQGKRLLPYTETMPKCLLPLNGRSVLEWQLSALAANGFRKATVVTGFRSEMVEAQLRVRPDDGLVTEVLFNPFFEVADNLGSCYMARSVMLDGPFAIINGDTLFPSSLLARARAQANGEITVTIDRKERYDEDDMKVSCSGARLQAIGKRLGADIANAESIGMLFFSGEGGRIFADAVMAALRQPAGLKQWYLSVIDRLASLGREIRVADIAGETWCEIDFPCDLVTAGEVSARLLRDEMWFCGNIAPSAAVV